MADPLAQHINLDDRESVLRGSREMQADSIANYVNGIGTEEDPGQTARPSMADRLTWAEIDILYLQNDLARRIVDDLVDDAVRGGWEATRKSDGTPVEEPDHLDIRTAVKRAGKLGRLYGGGHVFMVAGADEFDIEPDPTAVEIDNLLVLDRYEAQPTEYTRDIRDKNFGEPEIFSVTPNNQGGHVFNEDVHYKRLLSFGGNPVPSRLETQNNDYDDSVLQAVWSPLRNFCQTEAAIANIVQRFETSTISIAGLSSITQDSEGADLIQRRMQLLQKSLSSVNAALIDADAGESYDRHFANVQGLDTIWDRLAHSVAKAARQPMTQLFGMSPSGLATDDQSGRANWRKQVGAYQKNELRPALERYYSYIAGEPVDVHFPALDEMTAKEEAEVDKLRAQARSQYIDRGVMRIPETRKLLDKEGLIEVTDDSVDAFETDPYTGADDPKIPEHVPEEKRGAWADRWNEVYRETQSETAAFRTANALVDATRRSLPEPYDDYEVTKEGEVYSNGTKLEPYEKGPAGHLAVELWDDDERNVQRVHRLVMHAFGPEPPSDDHVVMHKNGDPTDNRLSNLEWGTQSENMEAWHEDD